MSRTRISFVVGFAVIGALGLNPASAAISANSLSQNALTYNSLSGNSFTNNGSDVRVSRMDGPASSLADLNGVSFEGIQFPADTTQ
jgi:hypothetical protein